MRIALRPSRIAGWGIASVAFATLALIAATPGDAMARILLATWVCCIALHALHRRRATRALLVRRTREIEVRTAAGWRAGAVRDGSFVAPWLTVIRWLPAGAKFDRTVVVLPDMLPAQSFRELRVMLRWA